MNTEISPGKERRFGRMLALTAFLLVMAAVLVYFGYRSDRDCCPPPTTVCLTVTEQHAQNISRLANKVRSLYPDSLSDTSIVVQIEKTRFSGVSGNAGAYFAARDSALQLYKGLDSAVQTSLSAFVNDSLEVPAVNGDGDGEGCANSCSRNCANGYMFICCPDTAGCMCSCDPLGYPRCSCS